MAAAATDLRAQIGIASCEGLRVDSIRVERATPTVTGLSHVPIVNALATQFHITTREDVIRRFLLLKTGDICTELRRTESERILRAQSFLAEARIDVLPSAG